jgi:hypothetical protein
MRANTFWGESKAEKIKIQLEPQLKTLETPKRHVCSGRDLLTVLKQVEVL